MNIDEVLSSVPDDGSLIITGKDFVFTDANDWIRRWPDMGVSMVTPEDFSAWRGPRRSA